MQLHVHYYMQNPIQFSIVPKQQILLDYYSHCMISYPQNGTGTVQYQ